MAFELKISGNYVVVSDTVLDETLASYPMNNSVYNESELKFNILELIDEEVTTITKADVDAGLWIDDLAVPFTQATLLTFLRSNTGFNPASGGSGADLLTVTKTLDSTVLSSLTSGFQLLPIPTVGTWHDVKEITYKYTYGLTPYFGLNTNNVFAIFGGGSGVKYQIYTNVEFFKNLNLGKLIWKQFPQTREDQGRLAYDPQTVLVEGNLPLTAYFSLENLIGGDGVLEIEIIYEVKTI